MKNLKIVFIIFTLFGILNAQEITEKKSLVELKQTLSLNETSSLQNTWTSRRITGLAYSVFIPGSGQYFLGHKLKGALLTLGFIGSLVTTVVSANDFIGNRERMDNLKIQYQSADKYSAAENIWKQIVDVHDQQVANQKRRDIFMIVSAVLWTYNIVDYIFLTEDLGIQDFAQNKNNVKNNFVDFNLISFNITF